VEHLFDYDSFPIGTLKHLKLDMNIPFDSKLMRKALFEPFREPVRIDCLELKVNDFTEMYYLLSKIVPVKLAIVNVIKDF
jgi:hypothetical protein